MEGGNRLKKAERDNWLQRAGQSLRAGHATENNIRGGARLGELVTSGAASDPVDDGDGQQGSEGLRTRRLLEDGATERRQCHTLNVERASRTAAGLESDLHTIRAEAAKWREGLRAAATAAQTALGPPGTPGCFSATVTPP